MSTRAVRYLSVRPAVDAIKPVEEMTLIRHNGEALQCSPENRLRITQLPVRLLDVTWPAAVGGWLKVGGGGSVGVGGSGGSGGRLVAAH